MIALENLEGLIMLPKSPKYFEVQLHAVYSCFVIQNYSEKKYYRNLPRKKRTENNKYYSDTRPKGGKGATNNYGR